ncbi:MAG: class I tRNA ligase family protein [Patescibacteria group bacterium]
MHKRFDHQEIEKKWQTKWATDGLYDVGSRDQEKEKEYVLVEWPYPSGNLHIGHWYAFAVPDIYVRFLRMKGKQVLFPMGFDAFGLPAENAAIKRGINPKDWTESNIEYMRNQLASMGNAFSWDKTTSSTDPEYYKWTQWMFTKFFENGLAYRGEGMVNWCPHDNTVIANEQVHADGSCDRCGNQIEKRLMPQWMLRITDFADALIDDLDALDWPEHIKEAQRQWIGRSEGAEIDFELFFTYQPEANANRGPHGEKAALKVFTTRPDTLFGATYLVLAPEHPWITLATDNNHHVLENKEEVLAYARIAKQKGDIERGDNTKEKTGIELKGVVAINPANNERIPIFVADYVLSGYGTGAIMAVPAHDERDFAFAKKFDLKIRQVVVPRTEQKGIEKYQEGKETLHRDCVDMIIEHPTDDTFLLQTDTVTHFVGGGTDGEPAEKAIRREIVEETGFTNFEIVSCVLESAKSIGFRVPKDKNQITNNSFYHVKLKDLTQVASEIDEGKHTVEWVTMEEVNSKIAWEHHRIAWNTFLGSVFSGSGSLINSKEFDGMDSEEAKIAITEKVGGWMTNTYRLRDWSIGRQRYWGVPIPIVYDPEGKAHAIPEEHLPWTLPEDVDFKPTGVPPLAKSQELKERTEKIFGQGWRPEVETMDTFVDSSWYFLRYIDNKNSESFSGVEAQKTWLPVDLYFGGAEHTTMHLLYSRFWQKALHRLGLAEHAEPYARRINRGLILGPDGNKMSKSKGNVIDPDEQVTNVGADTVKMYLAFMGPYAEVNNYPWDMGGIAGIRRFLERVNGLHEHITDTEAKETTVALHKTIKKVSEDIIEFKFNTAISAMMIYINLIEKVGLTKESYRVFLCMLAPFAPHITEELWKTAGEKNSIHLQEFPTFDAVLTIGRTVTIGVQINGKLRGDITIAPDAAEEDAVNMAKNNPQLAEKLSSKIIKKVVYVPGRILNIILDET